METTFRVYVGFPKIRDTFHTQLTFRACVREGDLSKVSMDCTLKRI